MDKITVVKMFFNHYFYYIKNIKKIMFFILTLYLFRIIIRAWKT